MYELGYWDDELKKRVSFEDQHLNIKSLVINVTQYKLSDKAFAEITGNKCKSFKPNRHTNEVI